jgi:hypothetical protein
MLKLTDEPQRVVAALQKKNGLIRQIAEPTRC